MSQKPKANLKTQMLGLIMELGYVRRAEAFQLASGESSHDYIDAKRAVADGASLYLAGQALAEAAAGYEFDAVGGLTMGADALTHAVSIVTGKKWFSVRKEPKAHGKEQLIEGAEIGQGMMVLLVDDVITTGGSILKALDAVERTGARAALAISVVDRGNQARQNLVARGVEYAPLLTYKDLGIDPVGA